ncbi:unnamed protein product [Nesidiocoris tenuis]|uniref:G-protein coupled receptors family 2 profile 1 domain-containing protein n=1 Tax=Nesidiocoris tenuis TaxID=355587 RepID=A0A6H5G895_9HEMI|nr:unnamed protein product [Nesidiocoris tenuis]
MPWPLWSTRKVFTRNSSNTRPINSKMTKDNKGEYFWPETIAGHVVELPCAVDSGFGFVARNNCTLAAHWLGANTTVCTFVSETTRILQQYAMDGSMLTFSTTTKIPPTTWITSYIIQREPYLHLQRQQQQQQQPMNVRTTTTTTKTHQQQWLHQHLHNHINIFNNKTTKNHINVITTSTTMLTSSTTTKISPTTTTTSTFSTTTSTSSTTTI